jgi:transmembrane protein
MPGWIGKFLDNKATNQVALIIVTFMFWSSGLEKLFGFSDAISEMNHFGLHPALLFAVATTLTLLVAPALIIFDFFAWLGAGWLGMFTILTIPIAHPFWSMSGLTRYAEIHAVREHLSMVGGLFFAAAICRRGTTA